MKRCYFNKPPRIKPPRVDLSRATNCHNSPRFILHSETPPSTPIHDYIYDTTQSTLFDSSIDLFTTNYAILSTIGEGSAATVKKVKLLHLYDQLSIIENNQEREDCILWQPTRHSSVLLDENITSVGRSCTFETPEDRRRYRQPNMRSTIGDSSLTFPHFHSDDHIEGLLRKTRKNKTRFSDDFRRHNSLTNQQDACFFDNNNIPLSYINEHGELRLNESGLHQRLGHESGFNTFYSLSVKPLVLNNYYAAKISTSSDDEIRDVFLTEFLRLAELSHPSIVSVYDYIFTSDHTSVIIMEYVDGINLKHFIRRHGRFLPENEYWVMRLFKYIANGVDYLHSLRIIHRDLKPENLIVICKFSKDLSFSSILEISAKITDFNVSKKLAESACLTFTGSFDYLAPESLANRGHSDHSDIWSFGLCIYYACLGKLSFTPSNKMRNASQAEYAKVVGKYKFHSKDLKNYTNELKNILKITLQTNPFDRPFMATICQHPWFSGWEDDAHLRTKTRVTQSLRKTSSLQY